MPTTREVTRLNNLIAQWYQRVQQAKRELQQQANRSSFRGPAPIVTDQAAINRVLQTGGQQLRNDINRLRGQVNSSTRGPSRTAVVASGPNASRGPQAPAPTTPQLLQDFTSQYQEAIDEANAANERRYEEGVEGRQTLADRITGLLGDRERQFMESVRGYGDASAERINRDYDRLGARAQANLVGRGITASTILPSVQRGVEDDRQLQLRGLGEDVQRLILGQQSALSGDTINANAQLNQDLLNFQERRDDVAPDLSFLAQLAGQFGQGNAGQGFGPVPQVGGQFGGVGGGGGVVGISAQRGIPGAVSGLPGSFIPGITPQPGIAGLLGGTMDLGQQLVGGAINANQAFLQSIQNRVNPYAPLPGQQRGGFNQPVQQGGGRGQPFIDPLLVAVQQAGGINAYLQAAQNRLQPQQQPQQGGYDLFSGGLDPEIVQQRRHGVGAALPPVATTGGREVSRQFNTAYQREHGNRTAPRMGGYYVRRP